MFSIIDFFSKVRLHLLTYQRFDDQETELTGNDKSKRKRECNRIRFLQMRFLHLNRVIVFGKVPKNGPTTITLLLLFQEFRIFKKKKKSQNINNKPRIFAETLCRSRNFAGYRSVIWLD